MSLDLINRAYIHYSSLSKREKTLGDKKAEESNPIFRLMNKYERQKKDFRTIIAGEAGNGKSSLALKFGEKKNPKTFIQDPEFAVDNQIHFNAKGWLHGQNYLTYELCGGWPVNDYDEPSQSGANHRQFMTEPNMVVTTTMVGMRISRFKNFYCIPFLDILDTDARKLCQIYINVYDQGRAEVFKIMNPKFGGEPWHKTILDTLRWTMPNERLWTLYETKKRAAQKAHEVSGLSRLERRESSERTDDEMLNLLKKNIDEISINNRGELDIGDMTSIVPGLGRDRAVRLRSILKREQNINSQASQPT